MDRRAGSRGAGVQSHMLCPCRVLEALWELLLQAILQALGANLDVSADFYSRFHFTLEVGPRGRGPPLGCRGQSCFLWPCCPLLACLWTTLPLETHLGSIFSSPTHRCWQYRGYLMTAVWPQAWAFSQASWGLLIRPWCDIWLFPGLSRCHLSWPHVPTTCHALTPPPCSAPGPGDFFPRRGPGSAPGEPEGWELQGEAWPWGP